MGLLLGSSADYTYRRKLLRGIVLRGPRLVDRHDFTVSRKSDGIGFPTDERVPVRAHLDPRHSPRLSKLTGMELS